MEDWNWKPRIDNDLIQRCVTIIGFSWVLGLVLEPIVGLFGIYGLVKLALDLGTVLLLAGAICKASIQYSSKGKAVLITGELEFLPSWKFCLKKAQKVDFGLQKSSKVAHAQRVDQLEYSSAVKRGLNCSPASVPAKVQ
jgi:hypothetical protein